MAATGSNRLNQWHQLDELTSKTIEAQGRLDYLRLFLDIEEGGLNKIGGTSSMKGVGE